MRYRSWTLWLVAAAVVGSLPSTAAARIKLITLPVRERVEIQLDNPNATLVEEERIVPLVQGGQSGRFLLGQHPDRPEHDRLPRDCGHRRRGQGDGQGRAGGSQAGPAQEAKPLDVKVLSVSYPPNEAALVWQVSSSDSGSARVRISYLWAT